MLTPALFNGAWEADVMTIGSLRCPRLIMKITKIPLEEFLRNSYMRQPVKQSNM